MLDMQEQRQGKAIGDMCLIAFYFLLRVGEYTAHRKGANTRTVQFRARDIVFWDKDLKVESKRSKLGETATSPLRNNDHR